MTRQQTIDKFRHDVSGVWLEIVLDHARGGELSIRLRAGLKRIDELASQFAQDIAPQTQPAVNGPAQRKVTT